MSQSSSPSMGPDTADAFLPFHYLRFAKTEMAGARFQLCMSGIGQVDLPEIEADGALDLEVTDAGRIRATAALREIIGARYGVPPAHVMPSLGTSGGVFLALSALHTLLPRDAPFAVERPAYPVFESAIRFLGRSVTQVERPSDEDFGLDPDRVEAAFTGGARVVCVTDLHNPGGVALPPSAVDALHELAERHDGWVLLDEVYRDFLPGQVGTGYRAEAGGRGPRVVTTSSLTKCYGVAGARAGWILGPPDLLDRADSITEITHGVDPAPSLSLALAGHRRADALLARSRRIGARGRPVIEAWIEGNDRLSWVPPAAGITGLVRVAGLADSMEFARRLRRELDIQVVPGAFFGAEGHIRISFGLPPARLQECLEILSLGLGALLR